MTRLPTGCPPGGRMVPEALDAALEAVKAEGKVGPAYGRADVDPDSQIPFFVNATSGSTVLGAYDDLTALAAVCSKHGKLEATALQKLDAV